MPYVTTKKFLLEFGFESLPDLPDIEALKDAGLLGRRADRRRRPTRPGERRRGSATA